MRKSIDVSDDGYLERLRHGAQSMYVRAVIDDHLQRCREAVMLLRASRSESDLIELLDAATVPAARYHETALVTLRPVERDAVAVLHYELELSGLDAADLVAALDGAHA